MSLTTLTHPDHPGVEKHVRAGDVPVYEANGWERAAAPEPAPEHHRKTKSRKSIRPDGAPDPKEQS